MIEPSEVFPTLGSRLPGDRLKSELSEPHLEPSPVAFGSIWEELVTCERLKQTDIDWFIRKGVPPVALAQSWDGLPSPILRDVVVHFPGGRFEFARYTPGHESCPSYILLTRDRFGEPSDLVAWSKTKISTWLGSASLLGEDRVFGIRLSNELLINSSPLTWLIRGRSGVFIVDPKQAAPVLRDHTMRAENEEHGRWLRQVFEVRPPTILISSLCGVA